MYDNCMNVFGNYQWGYTYWHALHMAECGLYLSVSVVGPGIGTDVALPGSVFGNLRDGEMGNGWASAVAVGACELRRQRV